MKNHMKKIITTVLLLLIIAALPVTIRAEEQKSDEPEQKSVVKRAVPATTPEQLASRQAFAPARLASVLLLLPRKLSAMRQQSVKAKPL